MFPASKANLEIGCKKYERESFFFPIIHAVLSGNQEGKVFVSDISNPRQFFVEHCFGFSQVFGIPDGIFLEKLKNYLLQGSEFLAPKIRLYSPSVPDFLRNGCFEKNLSFRQRFKPGPSLRRSATEFLDLNKNSGFSISFPSISDMPAIQAQFGVVKRFWKSQSDFLALGMPVVAEWRGQIASICYAAAVGNKRAEIDVLTSERFRKRGLGRLSVSSFVLQCYRNSIEPWWDCFSNNDPSMNLAKSCGFVKFQNPYPFFTFNART